MVDTLHPPSTVVLSWPKPNYTYPETRGPALFYVCIVLSAIAIVVVSTRLYGRLVLARAPGWDDALIVVALGFGISLSVLVIIGDKHWLSGHHIWDIPPAKLPGQRLNTWISEWCYVISTSATKISVLLYYRRISVTFSRNFMIATWVGIVYNVLYMVAFCLVLLSLCTPISAYWNSFSGKWVDHHPNYRCNAESIEFPLSGVFSVIGDLYSALLPMLVIFNLDLPLREKFSLYALFSMALLVVAAGITRTVVLWKLMNTNYDFTWLLWEMWIWAILEIYIAIIAVSLPALKPFFRKPVAVRNSTMMQGDSSTWLGVGSTSSVYRSGRNFNYSDRSVALNSKRLSLRESALVDEPEDIGLAFGVPNSFVIPEERFDQELIDQGMRTRHFELRHSHAGKMVPMQVWKPAATASKESLSWGTTLMINKKRVSAPPRPSSWTRLAPQDYHIRNFSHVWRHENPPPGAAVSGTARHSWRRSDLIPTLRPVHQHRQRPSSSNPADFTRSCPNINIILPPQPTRTRTSSDDSTTVYMSPLSITSSGQLSGTTARGDKSP
ncbi:hypothetical protein DV736_g464, partial [Chaetothyriales sp. CBS 134916]